MIKTLQAAYQGGAGALLRLQPIVLLSVRLLVARVFWNSGLAKVETFDVLGIRLPTWHIQNGTYFLFQHEYFAGSPKWFTDTAAVLSVLVELTLPLLLAFGFLTRIGALGLLTMTAVIQIFVYPEAWWTVHAWWAAALAVIAVRGPGLISVDRAVGVEPKHV